MLKNGTTKFSLHYMNYVLVEARDAFNMSTSNIIRDRFVKINLQPLNPTYFIKNTLACAASIEVSSGAKAEEINNVSFHAAEPTDVQLTRTDDTIVVLRAKCTQQSSRNNILQAAAYSAMRKQTVLNIQEMNK